MTEKTTENNKNKSVDQLIINTKKELAVAEKQLIEAEKKAKQGELDKNLLKVIAQNYTVAKNNKELAEQLGGKPSESSKDQLLSFVDSPASQSVAPANQKESAVAVKDPAPVKDSAVKISYPASDSDEDSSVTMTRHQYREELKHHHQK